MILNVLISLHTLVYNNTLNHQELVLIYSLISLLFLFGTWLRKRIRKLRILQKMVSILLKIGIIVCDIGIVFLLFVLGYGMRIRIILYWTLLIIPLLILAIYLTVLSGYEIRLFGKVKRAKK